MSAVALGGLIYTKADAQIGISARVNFRPVVVAYNQPSANIPQVVYTPDGQAISIDGDDFYYMPEVGAYYDVTDQLYIYFNGYNWTASAYLPGAYRDFDWTACRRFEIRAFHPFFNDGFYRERYAGVRVNDWNHAYFDYYRAGYARRNFDRDRDFDRRDNYNRGFDRDHDFDRRDNYNRGFDRDRDHHDFDNRGVYNGGYDRSRGGFDHKDDGNRDVNRGRNDFDRQKDNGYRDQNFNRNNGGFNQPIVNRPFNRPAQPARPEGGQFQNRGNGQPAFGGQMQNNGQNDKNGRFAQNRGRDNFDGKMKKF